MMFCLAALSSLSPGLLANVDPMVFGAPFCLPGFCPSPLGSGPPSGLMFLALGLIAVGVRGLLGRRGTRM